MTGIPASAVAFAVRCLFLFVGLCHYGFGGAPTARADEPRPNILFIAVDDLNDWIGCMQGHPQARTPNIDRLAGRGILFTNAHCAAPICLASRTALLCGRHPDQTGVYYNAGPTQGQPPARSLQLPVHLSASGYTTLGTGKIYHSPMPSLFDDYFDTEQRWSPFTPAQVRYTTDELPSKGTAAPRHVIHAGPGGYDWILPMNGLPSERNANGPDGESFDWGPANVKDDEMGDVRITDWATHKLAQPYPKPLFLAVGYYRPHIPLFAPQQDFDALPPVDAIQLPATVENDLDDVGPVARQRALEADTAGTHELVAKHVQWKQAVRAYLACVTFVDRQVGRLIDTLDASAHADNTWIILWSDHGWQLGEKEHWGKWTGWRQATRMPLIIVPPRSQETPRGKQCAEPVSLVDLYPTLIDVCQLPKKDGLSGISLAPLLHDPETKTDRAVLTTFDPGNHTLSTRDWSYIRYHTGEEELYDIKNDPHEWRNLAQDKAHQDKLNEMQRRLDRTLREIGANKPAVPAGNTTR